VVHSKKYAIAFTISIFHVLVERTKWVID
jgi:hypothetical protein